MTVYTLQLFGSPSLMRDGEPVTLDTRKALALLAYLAMTSERHSRDHLAGLLWPDYPQAQARASLRRTLSVLHQALPESELDISREALSLRSPTTLLVDVRDFRRHLADCQRHGHPPAETCSRCLESLSEAVALYHGDFLAGFGLRDSSTFDDWQYLQQESLRREMMGVLERLTAGYSARQQFDLAIKQALRWIELDRLHETAHRQLMLLYAWTGNRSAALHQYRICVRALEEALGVAPLEATTQLYEAIRENRPPPPPVDAGQPVEARLGSTPPAASLAQSSVSAAPPASTAPSPALCPLVERDTEWAALEKTYHSVAAGERKSGHLVILEGEAGIGKTRLAEEFTLALAEREKARSISARCYEGEANLAYWPLISALRSALVDQESSSWTDSLPEHWLGEAARLVPELAERRKGLASAPALDTPGAQTRFFEGLAHTLLAACTGSGVGNGGGAKSGTRPGLLFLDDIQWADRATLEVLTYIVRRLQEFPMCLLLTWRKIEVPNSPRIHRLIAEADRGGQATLLSLSRLSLAGIRQLAGSWGAPGTLPLDRLAEQLYQETEGLPLFLVEFLASLAGSRHSDLAPADWTLPGSVRELLDLRLQSVGESSLQILTTAAVIGRSFDFDTVWSASGRSEEETVEALEDLVSQGLVVDMSRLARSEPVFDFTHEQLRRLVYEETSLVRRRLLHRRVADALARRATSHREPGSIPGQIAGHYLEAGAPAQAALYFKLAGDRSRALYANAEALEHFRTALALGHPDAAGIHEAIGDLHTYLGTYGEALKSYQTAAALSAPEALPVLEHKIGAVYTRRGNFEVAESHFEAALESLAALEPLPGETSGDRQASRDRGAEGQRARIYADWSLAARNLGKLDQALELAERALALAEAAQDTQARAQAHNMLGILATGRGQLDQATSQLEESLALSEGLPTPAARIAALNNLALALDSSGESARAIELAKSALSLCISEGDRHREAALHNNLADLLHMAGRSEEALTHVKESVAIYAEIGVEAGTVQPQIWKLAEW